MIGGHPPDEGPGGEQDESAGDGDERQGEREQRAESDPETGQPLGPAALSVGEGVGGGVGEPVVGEDRERGEPDGAAQVGDQDDDGDQDGGGQFRTMGVR